MPSILNSMYASTLRMKTVLGGFSASLVILSILSFGFHTVYAQNIQKLRVTVYLWSKSNPGDVKVWVSYKGTTQLKIVNFAHSVKYSAPNNPSSGKKYVPVSFLFPPKDRGFFLFDWYTPCAKNVRTGEQACSSDYWWGDGPQTAFLQVYNTK